MLKLDDLAIPDWQLEHYVHINNFKGRRTGIYPHNLKREYPIMTQRGCPFSCSFCIESRYQDMFGKKNSLRRRDIDLVLQELHWAKKNLDIESVLFYDEVFTVNPRWLDEFLPRYRDEIGLPFWCYTYPTTHTPELLRQLKDAGMVSITMGIQSGSERILKEHFNRPTAITRVLKAAQEIVDLGSDVRGFFDLISKVPFETEDDLRGTFNFLLALPKPIKMLGIAEMTNFPTYDYTRQVDERDSLLASDAVQSKKDTIGKMLGQSDYDYYHKLYLLTRTDMPVEELRAIGGDPSYRQQPELLDAYLTIKPSISFTGISF